MEKLKSGGRYLAQTTPFILSNTIIIVPYLLYIHLINGEIPITVLPFVLFYTLRMTGIFLIRGIQRSIEKYTLLMLALLVGAAGAVFSLLGTIYFPFYLVGAIGLGLSGAWLPPANVTVNFYERNQGYLVMNGKKYLAALVLLLPLIYSLTTILRLQLVLVPIVYTLYFVWAYSAVSHYPHYELDFKGVSKNLLSVSELLWFSLFFGLLFLLRSARALFDEDFLNLAILAFCVLFIGAVFLLHQWKSRWRLPMWQNGLSFLNGSCGNFLFLFGTFYVAVVYGKERLTSHLFLPYLLGMMTALFFGVRLRRKFQQQLFWYHILGLVFSLLMMLTPWFSIAVLFLAFFRQSTSTWLNQVYGKTESLAEEQRITAKYATNNRGSIIQQFFLMILILFFLQRAGLPANELFFLTNLHSSAPSVVAVMEQVKLWACGGLVVLLLMIGSVKKCD